MELAAIAPMRLMEKWPALAERPVHMCLAQLALGNSKYLEWMRARSKEKKIIILDNGAYEKSSVTSRELAGLAAYMQPKFVVVPDIPNDPASSDDLAAKFYNAFYWLRDFDVRMMKIIHGWPGVWTSFCNSWREAATYDFAVGLSRLTPDFGSDFGKDRLAALSNLLALGWRPKYIHLFGFGGLAELGQLKTCNLPINSIDTSAPVWRGLNGYGLYDSWPDYPFELEGSYEWRKDYEQLALANLEAFDALLHPDRKTV